MIHRKFQWHAYPEARRGLRGVRGRLLWQLGFDPLTTRERMRQLVKERDDYKRWLWQAENPGLVWGAVAEGTDHAKSACMYNGCTGCAPVSKEQP